MPEISRLNSRFKEKYPEFDHILFGEIPYKKLFDLFQLLATVKYATKDQLNSEFPKIATDRKPIRKLTKLTELGYLDQTNGVYRATKKTYDLLKAENYNIAILPKIPSEGGDAHSLKCTDEILKARKEPFFYAIIYPYFKIFRPDFSIVYKDGDKAKWVMIEVERTEKPPRYLENKKLDYELLGKNDLAYRSWKYWAEKLGLRACSESEFCFGWRVV